METLIHTATDAYGEAMTVEEPVTDNSLRMPVRNGVCQFCGQVWPLPLDRLCYTSEAASAWATAHCDCTEGEQERMAAARQERYDQLMAMARRKREEDDDRPRISAKAKDTIEQLFGLGAAAIGRIQADPDVRAWLYKTAMLVYDGYIGKVTVPISDEDTACIATKKGVLNITRKLGRTQSIEVI